MHPHVQQKPIRAPSDITKGSSTPGSKWGTQITHSHSHTYICTYAQRHTLRDHKGIIHPRLQIGDPVRPILPSADVLEVVVLHVQPRFLVLGAGVGLCCVVGLYWGCACIGFGGDWLIDFVTDWWGDVPIVLFCSLCGSAYTLSYTCVLVTRK